MMENLYLLPALLFLVTVFFVTYWFGRGNKIRGIPEPKGLAILGHVTHIGGNLAKQLLEWKETMGPVYQLRFFKTRIVVFNDKESIQKVCSMAQSSGRARYGLFLKTAKLLGEGVANAQGDVWEEQRKFYIKAFNRFATGRPQTERALQEEIKIKLEEWEELRGAPFDLCGCSNSYVFNALWQVLGGLRLETDRISKLARNIAFISRMDSLSHKLAFIYTGIVEPFSSVVQEKMEAFLALSRVSAEMVMTHQTDRTPNQPRDVIDHILDTMDATKDEASTFHRNKIETGFALHEIIIATLDTTSGTLEWLLLYLAESPRVESRLRSEILSVVGADSSPSLSDREKMPFAQACILEALRLGSVVQFGLPHKAMEDFEFNGAVIPKGALLMMNLIGVHHDPSVFESPAEFKPERFLTPEGDKIDMGAKSKLVAFGLGKRMCPGSLIAMDAMFLFVVNAYRKFTFEVAGERHPLKPKLHFMRHPPQNVRLRAVERM